MSYQQRLSRIFQRSFPGFSLIELALVLIIIGILAGAIFKGQDILETAKIHAVLNDINRIRTAAILYHDTFGHWPGNDPQARARFGEGARNGQGNGIISENESSQFWVHLAKAGHFSQETPPTSRLGGNFSVEGDRTDQKNFLVLSGPEKSGLLTPKQASAFKAKVGENDPLTGQFRITEGTGASPRSCVNEGALHLATKTPVCILKVELQ